MQVLLIEDESQMRNMIRVYLNANDMVVTEAENGQQAVEVLRLQTFDVIILDLMMPVMDGFKFLEHYSKSTPVLVLSSKAQTEDKLRGFDLGIDDYLVKPFDLRELVARIRTLTRRAESSVQPGQLVPDLQLMKASHSLLVMGNPVPLTPKEFEILELLCRRSERVYTREELLVSIWGYDFEGDVRVVDTHVKNIRDKCKKAGLAYNPILTVWGVGYRAGSKG
ncbi:response regulator transcription factor [Tumebacillus lipolyticus]|uniref:Response regulator transcription factor n=1 Tax=Tumebacillus lipolyticus TaxID=1280370 RepID=A0ABW4ZWB3_9BACL